MDSVVSMSRIQYVKLGFTNCFLLKCEGVYQSWRKLAEHGAKTIYPVHGKPFKIQELVPCEGEVSRQ